mgnify:CR=1 FL=1
MTTDVCSSRYSHWLRTMYRAKLVNFLGSSNIVNQDCRRSWLSIGLLPRDFAKVLLHKVKCSDIRFTEVFVFQYACGEA